MKRWPHHVWRAILVVTAVLSLATLALPYVARWWLERPDPAGESSVAKVLDTARVLPVFESEEIVGVRVSGIAADSVWERAGVIDGDSISEIDGVLINSAVAAAEALQRLSAKGDYIKVGTEGGFFRLERVP